MRIIHHLLYVAHGVVTQIIIEDSELKLHFEIGLAVRLGGCLEEVEADDDRIVEPGPALGLPAPHGQSPGGHQARGRDCERLRVEAGAA